MLNLLSLEVKFVFENLYFQGKLPNYHGHAFFDRPLEEGSKGRGCPPPLLKFLPISRTLDTKWCEIFHIFFLYLYSKKGTDYERNGLELTFKKS